MAPHLAMNLAANGGDPSGDLLFVNFNQDNTYVVSMVKNKLIIIYINEN